MVRGFVVLITCEIH